MSLGDYWTHFEPVAVDTIATIATEHPKTD